MVGGLQRMSLGGKQWGTISKEDMKKTKCIRGTLGWDLPYIPFLLVWWSGCWPGYHLLPLDSSLGKVPTLQRWQDQRGKGAHVLEGKPGPQHSLQPALQAAGLWHVQDVLAKRNHTRLKGVLQEHMPQNTSFLSVPEQEPYSF